MDESRGTDAPTERAGATDDDASVVTRDQSADVSSSEPGRSSTDPPDPVPGGPVEESDRAGDPVRSALAPGESLDYTASAELITGTAGRPATVAVTDQRVVVLSADGAFTGVGHDRIAAVRGRLRAGFGLRGADYRLLIAAGGLLAVLGFVGVLGTAANAVTPVLALIALGGALAVERVADSTVGVDERVIAGTVRRAGGSESLAETVRESKERLNEHATDEELALAASGALALAPILAILVLDASALAALSAIVTIGGVALVRFAVRHTGEFDGFELVRRRYRLVRVALEDGDELRLRTDVESRLDRDLAAITGTARRPTRRDGGSRSTAPSESGPAASRSVE